jgi:hypothetical protein
LVFSWNVGNRGFHPAHKVDGCALRLKALAPISLTSLATRSLVNPKELGQNLGQIAVFLGTVHGHGQACLRWQEQPSAYFGIDDTFDHSAADEMGKQNTTSNPETASHFKPTREAAD